MRDVQRTRQRHSLFILAPAGRWRSTPRRRDDAVALYARPPRQTSLSARHIDICARPPPVVLKVVYMKVVVDN